MGPRRRLYIVLIIPYCFPACDSLHEWVQECGYISCSSYPIVSPLATSYTNGSKNAVIYRAHYTILLVDFRWSTRMGPRMRLYIVLIVTYYFPACDSLHEWVQECGYISYSSYHSTCRLAMVYTNGSKNAVIYRTHHTILLVDLRWSTRMGPRMRLYIVLIITYCFPACDSLHEWVQECGYISYSSYHSTCRLAMVYTNGSKNAVIYRTHYTILLVDLRWSTRMGPRMRLYIVLIITYCFPACDSLHEWVQEC